MSNGYEVAESLAMINESISSITVGPTASMVVLEGIAGCQDSRAHPGLSEIAREVEADS